MNRPTRKSHARETAPSSTISPGCSAAAIAIAAVALTASEIRVPYLVGMP